MSQTAPGGQAGGGSERSWLDSQQHRVWLDGQALRLLDFYRATVTKDGWFTELDDAGTPMPTGCPPAPQQQQNLLTVTRAIHSYALGELRGVPGCHDIVEQGLEMLGRHHDSHSGGYFEAVSSSGEPTISTKAAYGHGHVLLAASTAVVAGHAHAQELLNDALRTIDEHFWSEADGAAAADAYDRDWNEFEPYRGANANMHLCEALLTAYSATGDLELAQRARRLVKKFVEGYAREHDWLLPEHYDPDWTPLLQYNDDRLDDPFRPYGATVGHSLEWARLALCAGLATDELDAELIAAAEAIFNRGVELGWCADGGLVYTVDWNGQPANPDRFWWPVCEGIATLSYLLRITGKAQYEHWYRRFWEAATKLFIDPEHGGWFAMRDPQGNRKVHPWYGKPDIYHSLQACLLPLLPLAPSATAAAAESV